MLIKHSNDIYSWDTGKSFVGLKAKSKALLDGCTQLGITKFRHAAASDGISAYEIEMTIAEFRAKSNALPSSTRDGGNSVTETQLTNNDEDINNTVASN